MKSKVAKKTPSHTITDHLPEADAHQVRLLAVMSGQTEEDVILEAIRSHVPGQVSLGMANYLKTSGSPVQKDASLKEATLKTAESKVSTRKAKRDDIDRPTERAILSKPPENVALWEAVTPDSVSAGEDDTYELSNHKRIAVKLAMKVMGRKVMSIPQVHSIICREHGNIFSRHAIKSALHRNLGFFEHVAPGKYRVHPIQWGKVKPPDALTNCTDIKSRIKVLLTLNESLNPPTIVQLLSGYGLPANIRDVRLTLRKNPSMFRRHKNSWGGWMLAS